MQMVHGEMCDHCLEEMDFGLCTGWVPAECPMCGRSIVKQLKRLWKEEEE